MGISNFFKKSMSRVMRIDEQTEGSRGGRISPIKPGPLMDCDYYTIKPGDSLAKIAKRYYGDTNLWDKIFEANKNSIKDPLLLYPGQILVIPKSA